MSAGGATAALDTSARITIASGSLALGTRITLSRAAPTIRSLLLESAPLFADQAQGSQAFVLSHDGSGQPSAPVALQMRALDAFVRAHLDAELVVYVSTVSEGDLEVIPLLVPIEASFDTAKGLLTTVIPPWAFIDDLVTGQWATTFVVGTVLSPTDRSQPATISAVCPQPLILSPMATRVPPVSPWSPARTLNGVTRPHAGTDYPIQDGTVLFAAEGGTAYWRNNPSGYGDYVIINHGRGRQTLYAHLSGLVGALRDLPQSRIGPSGLQKFTVPIQKGDAIALSGHSGPPNTGIHLHLEYGTGGPTAVFSGGLSTFTVDPDPCLQYIQALAVTPDPLTLSRGGTGTLFVQAQDATSAAIADLHYLWTSSAPSVATVGGTGQVTVAANAANAATATISATSGGKSGIASVLVSTSVASVIVSPSQVRLDPGVTQSFTATALDAQQIPILGATFAWTSSDPLVTLSSATGASVIATVASTVPSARQVTITATSGTASGTAVFAVSASVASVTVSPAQVSLAPGGTQPFTATALDAQQTPIPGATFAWTSSDPVVTLSSATGASVIATVAATVPSARQVTITATSGTTIRTAAITVSASVASVTVSPAQVSLAPGGMQTFTATALDAENTPVPGATFAWTSSDSFVTLSSSTGASVIVTVAPTVPGARLVTITATSRTTSGTAVVTVSTPPFTGVWDGTYTYGHLAMTLTQVDSTVTGLVTDDAAHCMYDVTGSASGTSLSLPTWTVRLPAPSVCINAAISLTGTLSPDWRTLSGTGRTRMIPWTFTMTRQ